MVSKNNLGNLSKSKKRALTSNILEGLEDDQTILQLYRQCTPQRLNHLFPSDMYAHEAETECDGNMRQFWDSKTSCEFDRNNQHIIKAITNDTASSRLPLQDTNEHQHQMGGISINTPRNRATPASILATKGTFNTIQRSLPVQTSRKGNATRLNYIPLRRQR